MEEGVENDEIGSEMGIGETKALDSDFNVRTSGVHV